MSWKRERYFSGIPVGGASQPLPDEIQPHHKQRLRLAAMGVGILALGALIGVWMAPEAPWEMRTQLAGLQKRLAASQEHIQKLQQRLAAHQDVPALGQGHLKPIDRARHQREGRRYALTLRRVKAQGASELMNWFIGRWNQLLDHPQPEDRIGRRAAALSLLVGGMAANLNPGDYIPWQLEFFNGSWLGEVHFDIDGDGLPGLRSGSNAHDGFANVSICQIAMALNQAVKDARILVMPDMRCDRQENRMSVFLQGQTWDDALNAFAKAAQAEGFVVINREEKDLRLILVGNRPTFVSPEDAF